MGDNMDDTIWVLWWRYYDKSGLGIVRAYESEERGNLDFDLLEDLTDREFFLDEIPFFKE